jgi:hypothetical protein
VVERDAGSAKAVLNCGMIGPVGTPSAQSCTVTFPNVGTYAYDCLVHSGIPGNKEDMDGVGKVIPRPHAMNRVWTVWAGTGSATDEKGPLARGIAAEKRGRGDTARVCPPVPRLRGPTL